MKPRNKKPKIRGTEHNEMDEKEMDEKEIDGNEMDEKEIDGKEMDYRNASIYDLKKLLKVRGLRMTEVKDVAVIRLQTYDQNKGNVSRVEKVELRRLETQTEKFITTSTATIKYSDPDQPFYGIPMHILMQYVFDRLDSRSLWEVARTSKNYYVPLTERIRGRYIQFVLEHIDLLSEPLRKIIEDKKILVTGRGITTIGALHGLFGCFAKRRSKDGTRLINIKEFNGVLGGIDLYGSFENAVLGRKEKKFERQEKTRLYQERRSILNAEIAKIGYAFIYPFTLDLDGVRCSDYQLKSKQYRETPDPEVVKASDVLYHYVTSGVKFNWNKLWYYLAVMGTHFFFSPYSSPPFDSDSFLLKLKGPIPINHHKLNPSYKRVGTRKRQIIIPGLPELNLSSVDYLKVIIDVNATKNIDKYLEAADIASRKRFRDEIDVAEEIKASVQSKESKIAQPCLPSEDDI